MEKKCGKCGRLLTTDDFHKDKYRSDGLACYCKDCVKAYGKKYRNRPQVKKRIKEYKSRPDIMAKNNAIKRSPEYRAKVRGWEIEYNKRPEVKERIRERRKTQEFKEKERIYRKEYRSRPDVKKRIKKYKKEYDKEYAKTYYQKPEVKARLRKRYRKKMATDPNFRILSSMRARLKAALDGCIKASTTMELVGCSVESLRNHLESKFQDTMNWDNYGIGKGKWQIDHIVPCSAFDLTSAEEQKTCFHWSNLQPLWAAENIRKKDKTDGQLMLL